MPILSNEFKNWLKRCSICRVLGHKPMWMGEWWAPGHSTGYKVKCCIRCNKEIAREGGYQNLEPIIWYEDCSYNKED